MKIHLRKVSEAGNNCLADLFFDEVKVNVAGHLMMSVGEFNKLNEVLKTGTAYFIGDVEYVSEA